VPTVVHGDFEWDEDKAATNLAKHGVSFEEAVLAMRDPFPWTSTTNSSQPTW